MSSSDSDDSVLPPLHAAAGDADVDDLRRCLEEGVSPNLADEDGLLPLHHLCANRNDADDRITCLNTLVEAGADINARTRLSTTPLHFAAGYGHPKLVAAVVNAGANVNSENPVGTPLHWACRRHRPSVECVELLLNAGAAVNATTLAGGRTPLDMAIIEGDHQRSYPTLLRAGATYSRETTDAYLLKIRAAGGFRTYERTHLNAIAATFIPKLPLLPPEMVRRVVEYAFHVGDY